MDRDEFTQWMTRNIRAPDGVCTASVTKTFEHNRRALRDVYMTMEQTDPAWPIATAALAA